MDYRLKDVVRLVKKIDKLTDGQASIDHQSIDWDGTESFTSFKLQIRPNDGHYKGGIFDFTVTLPFDYPSTSPPVVWCNTRVYHPNIDMDETSYFDETSTNVCLNLFEYGTWQTSFSLDLVVLGLVFLFHHPNLEDPLAEGFSGNETEAEFAENVRKYMAGEEVNEMKYDTNFKVINGVVVENCDTSSTNNSNNQLNDQSNTCSRNPDESNAGNTDDIDASASSELSDSYDSTGSSGHESSRHDNNNNRKDTVDSSRTLSFSKLDTILSEKGNYSIEVTEVEKGGVFVIESKHNSSGGHKKDMYKIQNDTETQSKQNIFEAYVGEEEMTLEYIKVDGEFILKPKSIDIQETGVLKSDKDLVFRDCDLDADFDVDLESSIDTGSPSKPRGLCSCSQPLSRIMSRIFSRCRRSK